MNYKEGDVFVIPLKSKKYVIGLIWRVSGNILLANVFKNIFVSIPKIEDLKFHKNDILFVKLISSLGIKKGNWTIIGNFNNWNRDEWSVPFFKRKDMLKKNEYHKVFYDDNLNEIKVEYYSNDNEILKYPDDGLAGYGFIEKKLEKLLNE